MGDILCDLFTFLLDIVKKVVNVVASALETVGSAAARVLGKVVDDVSDALFGDFDLGKLLTIAALGLGAWYLVSRPGASGGAFGAAPESVTVVVRRDLANNVAEVRAHAGDSNIGQEVNVSQLTYLKESGAVIIGGSWDEAISFVSASATTRPALLASSM